MSQPAGRKALWKRCLTDYPVLWALAALLAAVVLFGHSYARQGNAGLVTGRPLQSILLWLIQLPLYRALFWLLQTLLLRSGAGCHRPRLSLWLGAGLCLCWLPWLYWIFPGTVSNDSVTQIMEIIGAETLGNANPIFQTGLIYLFRGVGVVLHSADAAVFLYCGLQALLMAWLLGSLLADMARSAAPRWLPIASFVFFAFCPIFPLFAFCMGKDTNFSMAVLWLSLLCLRLMTVPAQSKPGPGLTVCLCGAGVLCTLLRNPGIYLALLTLALLVGWALHRRKTFPRRWAAPLWALISVGLVYGLLHWAVIPGLGIAPMPETENYSVPLQQTARVAATHDLTQEEAAAIDDVLELDKLAAAYNGELSDPVKLLWRADTTPAQRAAFFRTWRQLLGKYPGTCLSATFHNTYGYLVPGYLSTLKPTLLIGRQKRSTPEVEAAFPYTVNPRAADLKAVTDRLSQFAPFAVLISPGLYGWVCLFAIGMLVSGRNKKLLIPAFPALFSLLGCLLSAVNGYFRYAMPLYLCAPLLLWLCSGAYHRLRSEDH